MKEILKKVRKYEVEIRKHINNSYQGDYKSLFKGTGLDFDDTRLYNYGDDHRSINWKNSAKEDKIFINTYNCLLYTSPSPRDLAVSRMPSSA